MTGSNTPWAKGPANFSFVCSSLVCLFPLARRSEEVGGYRSRMAHGMHISSPCVLPKRVHEQNIFIPRHILLVKEAKSIPRKRTTRRAMGVLVSFGHHVGAILHALGSLWNPFKYMSVDLESRWSVFKIYSFFP